LEDFTAGTGFAAGAGFAAAAGLPFVVFPLPSFASGWAGEEPVAFFPDLLAAWAAFAIFGDLTVELAADVEALAFDEAALFMSGFAAGFAAGLATGLATGLAAGLAAGTFAAFSTDFAAEPFAGTFPLAAFAGTAFAEPAAFASDLPPAAALAATFAGSFFVAK
jgi:hypothetical protein